MSTLEGVGSVDRIYDYEEPAGILVRLTKEVDLDALLFDLLEEGYGDQADWRFDEPTTLPGYTFLDRGREAQVAWFRKQVCPDGDFDWNMAFVSNEKPEGAKRYGAFLGVFLG
jgi:hypothetical protein